MKISLIIFTLFLLTSCQINRQEKQNNYTKLTSKIDSIINENRFNGVISLSTDSTDIYSKAFGFSDLENKVKINMNDQFVIGSISKQFTAVLILREFENGKIGLNDTIGKYLNEINQPWIKLVTIHQLLTHTHGIVDLDKALEFKQGSQFHYSQLGYELLARILEKVTGKTFKRLSTDFFLHYELKNTFHPENKNYKHLVKGYAENEKGVLEFTTNSFYNYVPAGSFISNAEDLKKWSELLYSKRLIKQETLELMKKRYATRIHPIFETIEYGYGLLFKNKEENIQIGALGYAPGFVSTCYYYPQKNMNLIILGNNTKSLNNLKKTFKVHTEIMELIKKTKPTEL